MKYRVVATVCMLGGAAVVGACSFKAGGSLVAGPGSSGGGGQGGNEAAGGGGGGNESAPPPASGAGVASVETITDVSGKQYHVQQSQKGEPRTMGCADGQREAFVDLATYPNIAGCLASWSGALSLRAPRMGQACGDDTGTPCASPADVCAPGWHVCAADGVVADLKQVSPEQCAHAGGGRFSAGMSHCTTQSGCEYDLSANAKYPCFNSGWCSEPVCCGDDCGDFGSCTGGVWKDATHIAQGTDQGCGASTSQRAGGILCCKG
jgi:hypothetical protein